MKFPTIEEMAKEIAEKAMNEYEYEGKTIIQWVEILKDYDDKKNTLERILDRLEEEYDKWSDTYKRDSENGYNNRFACGIVSACLDSIEMIKEEGGIE